MKKTNPLTLLSVIILMLAISSCSKNMLVTKSTNARDYQLNAHQSGLVLRPMLADLQVESTKKEVTYSAPLNKKKPDPLNLKASDLKSNALQLFLTTHNCDYVVDPVFIKTVSKSKGRLRELTINVSGFPAKYSKIYQVDSLPKSVFQYDKLNKPVKRLDYINSIEDNDTKFGLEATVGNVGGAQFDYVIKDMEDVKLRAYVSIYVPLSSAGSLTGKLKDKNDNEITMAFGGTAKNFRLGLGIMPEFFLGRFVKIRLNGGLNISPYILENTMFSSVIRLGVQLGGGLDVKLYKNLSIIGKFHSNVNFADVASKKKDSTWEGKILVKKFSNSEYVNGSVGLRLTF